MKKHCTVMSNPLNGAMLMPKNDAINQQQMVRHKSTGTMTIVVMYVQEKERKRKKERNKAVYTANPSRVLLGRGSNK